MRYPPLKSVKSNTLGITSQQDDNFECAIRRELLEETGYGDGEFYQIGSTYANPANQSNRCISFFAIGVHPQCSTNPDPNEEIEIVQQDFISFSKNVTNRKTTLQGLHIATLHFAIHFIIKSRKPSLDLLRKNLKTSLFK